MLLEQSFERTLDRIIAGAKEGDELEAWLFDDRATRLAAERLLAEKGVKARLRSAYKPLLHAFLEEINLDGVQAIEISYPTHEAAPQNRFRLECYPLVALVGERPVNFIERHDDALHYDVRLSHSDGRIEDLRVFAPNHLHDDAAGEPALSPTGWIKRGGEPVGERLITDYEQVYQAALAAIAAHDWGKTEPFFEELNLRVEYPAQDEPLDYGDEVISLKEALHEDLYFSAIEFFTRKTGRAFTDRTLRPGQIVPEVVKGSGKVTLRIEERAFTTSFLPTPVQPLDEAIAPLSAEQIASELEGIGGSLFTASARSGRKVQAVHVEGADAPVMISGGQHANETTGIVGALRAARILSRRESANFTLAPGENPDGYALHQRLRQDNPRHMSHAARYTALGDDLEYRDPDNAGPLLFETAIRIEAEKRSGARLHVNLHGYPAHEWTRPLSGYIPRNFAMWTLPKGFFLIVRHHQGWDIPARKLTEAVTRRLAKLPGLLDMNARQIKLFEQHAGETGFEMINGFPCLVSLDERNRIPVTLITEYPDETIYGDAFVAGHTAQCETVLAAYEAWQEIAETLDAAPSV